MNEKVLLVLSEPSSKARFPVLLKIVFYNILPGAMEPGSVSGKPPDGQQVIKRLKIRKYFLDELILLSQAYTTTKQTTRK